jgi:phosphoribosylanthranilate isomerase
LDTGTQVRISGITNWEDAKTAVDAGADALGFVCDENSPRLIDPDTFCTIATRLPAHVQYTHDSLWTDIVRENWDMRRKIKAFSLTSDRDLRRIAGYNGLVQSFLLNVHAPQGDEYGWELAREVHQYGKRLYLSGGLTPENVARATARVHPYAVDVTVGVESSPGVLDRDKVRAFVEAVKNRPTRG